MSIIKFGCCALIFCIAIALCELPTKEYDFTKVILTLAAIGIGFYVSTDER